MKQMFKFFLFIILTGTLFSCPVQADNTSQSKSQPVDPRAGWYSASYGYIPITLFVERDASWGWGFYLITIPYTIDLTKNIPTNWQIPPLSGTSFYEMDITTFPNPQNSGIISIHFKQNSNFPN